MTNVKKKWFTNTAPVSIGGKQAGEEFPLEVDVKGNPVDRYWRKRLAEGAIKPQALEQATAPKPTSKKAQKGNDE